MGKILTLSIEAVTDDTSFIRCVRALSVDSGRVKLTQHARERMVQRQISIREVIETLRKGRLIEPAVTDVRGEWVGRIIHDFAGQKIHVVTKLVIRQTECVLIITTF